MTLTAELPPAAVPTDGTVRLDWIRPSHLNPRRHFDETALTELAESIKTHGLLEPIVVRETEPGIGRALGPHLEIIAGERRYRAAKLAGLESVPVRNLGVLDDATALQLAIVENLQRQDLDPIEEAEGFAALNRIVGMKQSEIAAAVKRSQPAIANRMRLLELPESVREMIRRGDLSPSHGVALARWAKWPKLVVFLAEYGREAKWTSKELEGNDILASWPVLKSGLVIELGQWSWHFDRAVCDVCPFDALHRREDYQIPVCLNPDHARELEATHQAALAERAKAATAAAATLAQGSDVEDVGLPDTNDLGYQNYKDLRYATKPEGCDAGCPCLGQARDGSRTIPVCLDPKRFAKLERAATIAKNKARRADAADLKKRALAQIDRLSEVGHAETVILVKQAMTVVSSSYTLGTFWNDARKRHRVTTGGNTELDSVAAVARKESVLVVMKVALEALLTAEIQHYAEEIATPVLTRWWLNAKEHPESLLPREKGADPA